MKKQWELEFEKLTNYLVATYGVDEYIDFIKRLRDNDEKTLLKILPKEYRSPIFAVHRGDGWYEGANFANVQAREAIKEFYKT